MKLRASDGIVGLLSRRVNETEVANLASCDPDDASSVQWANRPVDLPAHRSSNRNPGYPQESLLEFDDRQGEAGDLHHGLPEALAASETRMSLLERLARSGRLNQEAWSEFVRRYGRRIYGWCLRWKLQDADAEDVTQIVLLKLARRMKDFTYDPRRSFRAWLKTVTHHAWQDFVASRQTAALAFGGDAAREHLASVEARDDLSRDLERLYDLELLQAAMLRVRLRAAVHTWTAFSMTAVEGITAPEVARRLGMKIARVYSARNVIQQRLQEECRRLESAQQAW